MHSLFLSSKHSNESLCHASNLVVGNIAGLFSKPLCNLSNQLHCACLVTSVCYKQLMETLHAKPITGVLAVAALCYAATTLIMVT